MLNLSLKELTLVAKKKKKEKKESGIKSMSKNKLLNMLNTQEPIKGNKTIKGIRA